MPTNLVKTAADERRWSKAKHIAAQSGRGDNYAYIVGIYKKMTRRNPQEIPLYEIIEGVLGDLDRQLQATYRDKTYAEAVEANERPHALYHWLHNHQREMMEYAEEQWNIAVASDDESGVKWTYDSVSWMRPVNAGKNERLVEIHRGDTVDAWIRKGEWMRGTVTGISKAKDQIAVNDIWFDYVRVYSLAERGEAPSEPEEDYDWHFDWFGNNSTVEVADPKPRAAWINIDWSRETPHGEWKTNYAWNRREKRWARGQVAPLHVIREAKKLSEYIHRHFTTPSGADRRLPEAGTGFGEVGLLSDKYGWVVVAAPDDSKWINILHLVKGEDKPREYGFNKSQQRWARRTVPPGDLREEIKKAGWKVK